MSTGTKTKALVFPATVSSFSQLVQQLLLSYGSVTAHVKQKHMDRVPAGAADAVRTQTTADLSDRPVVTGYDFNGGIDYEKLLASYLTTGFQATNFALAVEQINQMVSVIPFLRHCL